MNILGIELVKTCSACPEQYNAYLDGLQVGYLRLRHGIFSVDFPYHAGYNIFYANPKGDGIFYEDEREYYLTKACQAILNELEELEDDY